ncbi:MAG: glucan biosynthesis glucosyltransferase, partial [Rhodoferax sp.]|nr:glucan biosynthesis glucosyltransferase [Rhodoferax sp.]
MQQQHFARIGRQLPANPRATRGKVVSLRSSVREERHPNAVTAPPVHRGSMAPLPWRGFWN